EPMSYRALKHLLGETSLERKCLFLFGTLILLLITASFWWYAHLTEDLAYEQTSATGQLLVNHILANRLLDEREPQNKGLNAEQRNLHAREQLSVEQLPEPLRKYQYRIIRPKARSRENQPDDSFETELLKKFQADPKKDD